MRQILNAQVFAILAYIAFVNADFSLEQSKGETLPKDQPQLPNLPGDFQQVIDSCGLCPAGKQKEQVSGPYCGRCLLPSEFCGPGYHISNGQCLQCRCPSTNRERRFGYGCRLDYDEVVTCYCAEGHTGRDCSDCAPGYVQYNQYPYNCLKIVDGFNTRGFNSSPDNVVNVDNSSHQNKISGEFLLFVVVGAYSLIIAEIK